MPPRSTGVTIPVPDDTRERAIAAIRRRLIEKKMTQAQLAEEADCHEKTIQNLLAGKSVRDQTLFDVCSVLDLGYDEVRDDWHGSIARDEVGINVLPDPQRDVEDPQPFSGDAVRQGSQGRDVAPVYMGAYSKAAVDHYIASYLTIRPDFTRKDHFVAYRTDVTWDDEWPSLLFQETGRPDAAYAHRGRIYVPASSMFIHLVSLTKGAMRMIVASQLDRDKIMRGIITTLNRRGATYVPVSTPIVYAGRNEITADALGLISPAHPAHGEYAQLIEQTVADGYAKLIQR
jgi:transcriptional regulator with XRE-family HTH domain